LETPISLFKRPLLEIYFFCGRGNNFTTKRVLTVASLHVVFVLLFFSQPVCPGQIFINENFDTLANWTPVLFPGIDRHSEYEIQATGTANILVTRSNASASGIRFAKEFNVYEYPVVRWRWKVDHVYEDGDVEKKSGDDYPLRIYIMFKYDSKEAGLGDKIIYSLAKAVYGEYPPHSSLNYIWANKPHEQAMYPSPYTDKAKLIILRAGNAETGTWKEEEVNIVEDYKKAFAVLPPHAASIAIMNDSDNTGESSVSYLDYIQVLRKE